MSRRENSRVTLRGGRFAAVALAASTTVLSLVPPAFSGSLSQPSINTIVEIRVHGNQSLAGDEVVALARVSVGDRITEPDVSDIEDRLLASGRFDLVDVRMRYRSLTATDQVVLVVVVRERAGATSSNPVVRLLAPLARRMLFLPILDYTEGYGVTYGGRASVVDILGADGRLSVPATWGGTKQIAAELERSFNEGATRLQGGGGLTRRRNPHFETDEDRVTLWVSTEQRLPANFHLGGRIEWADVAFGRLDDTLASYGMSLTFDTRRNAVFPRNAVRASVAYEWLDPSSGTRAVGRPSYEVQAYQGLIGQTVLAARASYHGADGPLPPFEQMLFGGGTAGRGWQVGSFVGDRLVVASVELRAPFSSPFSVGEAGVKVFYDTGAVYDAADSLGDARFRHGAGLGVFLQPPFAEIGVDVAHNLIDQVRVHVVATLSF